MNVKLRSAVMATLASTFLLGFGSNAMADSTYDLVQALVDKGVLTEEEAIPLLKSREADNEKAAKEVKKGRVSISDAIDNAKLYGDIRVRAEERSGDEFGTSVSESRTRARYKVTFGVKTEADDFYTDLAFAMSDKGSSDNATLGQANGKNTKDGLFVKRAMIGWKATDWLTLEAGRVKNPLYTTPMVWDGDFTMEGLVEKFDFKMGETDVFLTAVQSVYKGDKKSFDNATGDSETNALLAFQGGAKFKITDDIKAKAALTYTTYTNDDIDSSTKDLNLIEIPAEISFAGPGSIGYKVYADYAFNMDGDDRCKALSACNAGDEDNAWLIGAQIASVADPKGKATTKGDWKAKLWYQSVGAFAVDPNVVDSDFFDSRVNMEGVIFKGEYALRDNVFINFAAGKGQIKEDAYNTYDSIYTSQAGDISKTGGFKLDDYELYQLDMTYKF
jgi:polyhydroxyalkanoate synthesis regulator phasin